MSSGVTTLVGLRSLAAGLGHRVDAVCGVTTSIVFGKVDMATATIRADGVHPVATEDGAGALDSALLAVAEGLSAHPLGLSVLVWRDSEAGGAAEDLEQPEEELDQAAVDCILSDHTTAYIDAMIRRAVYTNVGPMADISTVVDVTAARCSRVLCMLQLCSSAERTLHVRAVAPSKAWIRGRVPHVVMLRSSATLLAAVPESACADAAAAADPAAAAKRQTRRASARARFAAATATSRVPALSKFRREALSRFANLTGITAATIVADATVDAGYPLRALVALPVRLVEPRDITTRTMDDICEDIHRLSVSSQSALQMRLLSSNVLPNAELELSHTYAGLQQIADSLQRGRSIDEAHLLVLQAYTEAYTRYWGIQAVRQAMARQTQRDQRASDAGEQDDAGDDDAMMVSS